MADTAFDPNLPPEYQLPPAAAAAPLPQGGGDAAQRPAPGPLPAQLPAPPAQALTPGVPPSAGPPQPSAEDVQDETDYVNSLRLDADKYGQRVDHRRGQPITVPDQVDPEQDPRIVELRRLRQLIPQMTPNEQRSALTQWNSEHNRVRREIDATNKAAAHDVEKKHMEDLKGIDAPFEKIPDRMKSAEMINNDVINPIRLRYSQGIDPDATDPNKRQLDLNDPKVKSDLDYTNKTSPLSTMGARQFRDVVTSIAMRNPGMSPQAAAAYALAIGSPTEMRPDNPLSKQPAVNGQKGAGAANYQVLGGDYNRVFIVRTSDGNVVRVDPTSYQELVRSRYQGYKAAKQFLREQTKAREDAAKPDMLQRGGQAIYDYIRGR